MTQPSSMLRRNCSARALSEQRARSNAARQPILRTLKVLERQVEEQWESPPWLGVPPDLPTYRQRGHQRLDARTYEARCKSCIWGCKMAVEMIIDQWNPSRKKYRSETFCYGPKSCSFYKAGPTRKVPGRKGMSWTEEDWVDEDATSHRSMDE